MPGAVEGRADGRDVRHRAGRSLVVNDADGLDRVRLVGGEASLDRRHVGAAAPVAGHEVDGKRQPLGQLLPQRREVSGLGHQHAVAGRERVHERGFPRAGPRCRVDDDVRLGREHPLHACQDGPSELAELGAAMVDRRAVDRAKHAVGNVRRSRNLQEVPTLCHVQLPSASLARSCHL